MQVTRGSGRELLAHRADKSNYTSLGYDLRVVYMCEEQDKPQAFTAAGIPRSGNSNSNGEVRYKFSFIPM